MPQKREPLIPTRLELIWNDRILSVESYASGLRDRYYKARRPGGGTIEVHLLGESHFVDHSDAPN